MSKKPSSSSSTRGGRGRGGRHDSAPAPAAAGSKGSPGSTTSSLSIDPDPPLALHSSAAAASNPTPFPRPTPLPFAASYPPSLASVLGGGTTGQGGGGQGGVAGAGGSNENPLETLFSAARQLHLRAGPQAAAGGVMAPYPGLGGALGGGSVGGGAQGGGLNALQQLLALQQQGAGALGGGMIGAGATAAAAAAAAAGGSSSSSSSSSSGGNDRAALGALLDAAGRMGGGAVVGAGTSSNNNKRPFDVAMGGSASSTRGPGAAAATITASAAAAAAPGAFVPPNLGLPAPARPFPANAPPGAAAFLSVSMGGRGRPPLGTSSSISSFSSSLARHPLVPAPGATAGSFRFPSSMLPSGTFPPYTPPGPPPTTNNLAFSSLVGSISDVGSGGSASGGGGGGGGGGWSPNISSIIRPQHDPAQQHAGTGTSPPSVPVVAPVIPVIGAPLGLGLPSTTSLGKAVAVGGLGLLASASSASPCSVRSGRSEEGSGGGGSGGGGGRRHHDSDLDDDVSDEEEDEESDEEEELDEEGKPRLGRKMRARHARRRATQRGEGYVGGGGGGGGEEDESKVERRKERARMYSSAARKKQETNMKDLKLEMECLTVYRLMIDECPDMVAVLSPDSEGRLLFANAAFTALLRGAGMAEAAEQQQAIWPLFHESHRSELLKAARAVMAEGNDAAAGHIRLRLRTPLPAGEEGGGEYELSLRYSQTGIIVYMRPNEGPADVGGEGAGAGKGEAAAGQAKSPA